MGIQDNIFPQLLSRAERAPAVLTDAELLGAATTQEEGEKWVQLCNNLKYILINITSGAATVCKQYQEAMGLEVYRQLCNRFATPVGTRSIGYLTKLLKPTFDINNFEESFSTWQFELARYERDNNAQLPDQVKIAVLMNDTKGPLQQHLHLNASATPTYAEVRATIMEYYRTTTAFSRLQQQSSSAVSGNLGGGPAPMDIGATYEGKGKGNSKEKGFNKEGHKGKGYQQGKGYGGYGSYNKGKGKGKQQQWYEPKRVEKGNNGKSKGPPNKGKGKNPTATCYRCGQQGHLAKDCRTAVYNMAETPQEQKRMEHPVGMTTTGAATTSQAITILNQPNNNNNNNNNHLHPDDLHATSVDNNTPRWWIVMTIEEYNSIKPTEADGESTNKVIQALLGRQGMPNFDKLILAPSPQLAVTTMYMHSTEMHVATKIPTKWLMITWVEDVQQHRLRTGNQVINMFNRGYMYPQQQIESGCNIRFTTFELASQQTWEISADGGNTMLQQICNYFPLEQGVDVDPTTSQSPCPTWLLKPHNKRRDWYTSASIRRRTKLNECSINICGWATDVKPKAISPVQRSTPTTIVST